MEFVKATPNGDILKVAMVYNVTKPVMHDNDNPELTDAIPAIPTLYVLFTATNGAGDPIAGADWDRQLLDLQADVIKKLGVRGNFNGRVLEKKLPDSDVLGSAGFVHDTETDRRNIEEAGRWAMDHAGFKAPRISHRKLPEPREAGRPEGPATRSART